MNKKCVYFISFLSFLSQSTFASDVERVKAIEYIWKQLPWVAAGPFIDAISPNAQRYTQEQLDQAIRAHKAYLDRSLNTLFDAQVVNNQIKPFPFTLSSANLPENIFQIATLSQSDPDESCGLGLCSCIHGNTCGRHAAKNALFGFFATYVYDLLRAKPGDTLLQDQLRTYGHIISGIGEGKELDKQALCILAGIDVAMRGHRKQRGVVDETDLGLAPLELDEVKHTVNTILDVAHGCRVAMPSGASVFAKNVSVVPEIGDLFGQLLVIGEESVMNAARQAELFRTQLNYRHAFILGMQDSAKPGLHHWVTVVVYKRNGISKFIVFDSAENNDQTHNSLVTRFIDFLRDPSVIASSAIARAEESLILLRNPRIVSGVREFGACVQIFNGFEDLKKYADSLRGHGLVSSSVLIEVRARRIYDVMSSNQSFLKWQETLERYKPILRDLEHAEYRQIFSDDRVSGAWESLERRAITEPNDQLRQLFHDFVEQFKPAEIVDDALTPQEQEWDREYPQGLPVVPLRPGGPSLRGIIEAFNRDNRVEYLNQLSRQSDRIAQSPRSYALIFLDRMGFSPAQIQEKRAILKI